MSDSMNLHILIILSLWLGYFALHSLLASLRLKSWVARHFSRLMPGYRLMFNGVSVLLLLPILWLSARWQGEPLWHFSTSLWWLMTILSVLTVIAFFISLRYYDMDEFIGLKQWREGIDAVEDQEHFVIGDFHRFVRHPWYTMGIILVWSRELDPIMLTNAIMITLYFVIGSRFEERKLHRYHGEVYQRYAELVPALIPRPWRFLTRQQARMLLQRNPADSP